MRRISSKWTFFYKQVFPVIWFGFLSLFVLMSLIGGATPGRDAPVPFLIIPVLMAIFGYFMMKKLVFDLVDEVFDGGDALVVKDRHQEERIALSNITNVSYSSSVRPPRVTLSLREPSINFGGKISFCAPVGVLPFAASPVIDALIRRIDAERIKENRPHRPRTRPSSPAR